MQLLKENGSDLRERRNISKLYMDQNVKYDWTNGRQEV
jgi:hypothetical protein